MFRLRSPLLSLIDLFDDLFDLIALFQRLIIQEDQLRHLADGEPSCQLVSG